MDIDIEKAAIIRRLQEVEDESIIRAIRLLLDVQEQDATDSGLEDSVNRALAQSQAGEVRPHQTVMSEIRNHRKA